jgi:GNAT superfamily N-acetyltransferase
MRADLSDTAVRDAVYALFDTSFGRLSERIALAGRMGAVWHDVSTAFAAFDGDTAVAHTGVIEIPMVIGGERRTVAGVHAVCTRPGYRGRGYSRAVLTAALAHVDQHYDLAILATEIPGLYERFGFRTVTENVFVPALAAVRTGRAARRLSADRASDVQLAHDLLARREPVSHIIASVDSGWLLLIDEALASFGLRRLYYAEELDAIVAFELRERTLVLIDVVAPVLPALDAVLRCIPEPFDNVELMITPDRLWDGACELRPSDPRDLLMVRGRFGVKQPFMLSQLARC